MEVDIAHQYAGIIQMVQEESKLLHERKGYKNSRYMKAYDLFNQVRTHSDSCHFPEKLFRDKAPNETEAEFEYRKSIYKSATYWAWSKAVGALSRIMNDQNYVVTLPEENDALKGRSEEIDKYLFFNYPEHESISEYFKSVVFEKSLEDPNAAMVIMPYQLEVPESETTLVDSVCRIFPCYQVLRLVENEYALLVLNQEEDLPFNVKKAGQAPTLKYLFIDTDSYIFLHEKKQKNGTRQVVFESVVPHGLEDLPARFLKGKPTIKGGEYLYESYLYPAVPTLDRATCDQSTLDISKYSHAFLQRWEYVRECSHKGCVSGKVPLQDENGQHIGISTCPSCKGTGTERMIGAMQGYQIEMPTREGDAKPQLPPAGYIDLDHSILDFLSTEIDKNITKAFMMLNIDVSNSEVKGGETALGKQIDREELFSFMTQISSTIYSLFEWAINLVAQQRYGDLQNIDITVSKPTSFDIRSSQMLLEEMKNTISPFNKFMVAEYTAKRFGIYSRQKEVLELIIKVDSLFGLEPNVIQGLVSSQTVPKWKATLHFEAISILDDIIAEGVDVFEMGVKDLKTLFEEEARSRTEERPNTATPTIGVDDILGKANA